ncbi:hypothetical protein BST61_g715 [Cercospora zeina]
MTDVLDQFKFDAFDTDNTARLNAAVDPAFGGLDTVASRDQHLLAELHRAAAVGDVARATEVFTTLRYTDASSEKRSRASGALSIAIKHEHERMAASLLSEGARPVSSDVKEAVRSPNQPIVRLLLEHGWPINAKLGWYDPPALAYAVEDLDPVRWLLSQGADPNAVYGVDKMPLSLAVLKAPISVIETLFAYRGTVRHGQLLHWAVSRKEDDRLAVIKYLLQKEAPINAIMYENHIESFNQRKPFGLGTALHGAARLGDLKVIKILLAHGADVSIQDSCGRLPFDLALREQHHLAAGLLWPR